MKWQFNTKVSSHIEEKRLQSWAISDTTQYFSDRIEAITSWKKYKEVHLYAWSTIDDAVNLLLEYKNKRELAALSFNGHILYSDLVSLNKAYKEITWISKKEHTERQEKWLSDYEKEELESEENFKRMRDAYISEWNSLIEENFHNDWVKIVDAIWNGMYKWMLIEHILTIMKMLKEKESIETIKWELDKQGHSWNSIHILNKVIYQILPESRSILNTLITL